MADLVPGHVDMMFDGLGTSAPQMSGGAIRALAVAAPQRTPAFPDVPTAAEAGLPGFEVSTWYAIWAPKGASAEIVERMKREVKAALDTQTIKDAWAKNGSPIPTLQGAEFGAFVTSEVARWAKVVKDGGVRLESQ
jgi:tripartite-type tricarboxylate transporter receptor subunit TctC